MKRKRVIQLDTRRPHPAVTILTQRWGVVLVALFLFGLCWRLAYQIRLAGSPLAGSLRLDERDYWDWATYLLGHGLHGTNAFFLGPLYPYVLALVRAVVGSDVARVLVVQAVWGSAAVVLLADAACSLARPAVALGLGLALALYEMSVLHDGLILMESFLFFLEALLLWLWCRACLRPSNGLFVAIAALTGAAAQCRATAVLLIIPGVWIALRAGNPPRATAGMRVVGMCGLLILATCASATWNWSVSRELIPFTYNFGYNLYVGNNPAAEGTFVNVAGDDRSAAVPVARPDGGASGDGREYLRVTRGLVLSPSQSSAYWAREAIGYVQHNPTRALSLLGAKLLLLFNRREIPQIESIDLFRRTAGPLGLPWFGSFLLVGALGVVGLLGPVGPPVIGTALRLYVMLLAFGILPFFVTDRFRLHLVPGLALLGACAVDTIVSRSLQKPTKQLGRLTLATLGAMVLVGMPVQAGNPKLQEWNMAGELGLRWLDQGRPDLAALEFEKALRLEGSLMLDVNPAPALTQRRALDYFNYGVALHRTGRDKESLTWLRRAASEDSLNATYVRTLADAYLVSGRVREGDSLLQRASSLVGGGGEVLVSEGWQAAREGNASKAEELFQRAIATDARLYGAWGALIRIQVQQGKFQEARATWERAAQTAMPRTALRAYEALVDAGLGDSVGAEMALSGIPLSETTKDPTLARVTALARDLLSRRR